MTDYKSMFEQAVRTLAAIDDALGIGADGCGDPDQTLTAIAELRARAGVGSAEGVTLDMVTEARDMPLESGDVVLSARLLERIYFAMSQAAPPQQTPFDTCPTCEALARTVMMDQTSHDKRFSECPNCFDGKSDLDHTCRKCGGTGKEA